jgi:hypothetical protein
MSTDKVTDFMGEFVEALTIQLVEDEKRWGDTWLNRTHLGQEERTVMKFNDYFDQYFSKDIPVPWLKIVGNAMICWIREKHPELWEE